MVAPVKNIPVTDSAGSSAVPPQENKNDNPPPLKVAVQDKSQGLAMALSALQEHAPESEMIPQTTLDRFAADQEEHDKMLNLLQQLNTFNKAIRECEENKGQMGQASEQQENQILEKAKSTFQHYFDLAKEMIKEQAEMARKNPEAVKKAFKEKVDLITTVLSHGTQMLLTQDPKVKTEHANALKAAINKKRYGIEGSAIFRPENKKYNYALSAMVLLAGLVLAAYAPIATAILGAAAIGYAIYTYKKSASNVQEASAKASQSMAQLPQLTVK